MATLTGQTIASTYDGLLKLSDNDGLTASVKNIQDGLGVSSPVNISTAVLFIKPTSDTSSTPTSGKEFEVVGNALITGDLQVDNINIDGNTISATSGVVTLASGAIATTQSQNDNSTKIATTAYVDSAVDGVDTLAEILAIGNTTGSTKISINNSSSGVDFVDNAKARFGTGNDLNIYHDSSDTIIENETGNLFIINKADNMSMIFQNDDSTGGVETYFFLDGGDSSANPLTIFPDNARAGFGGSADLIIYHDGSNSYIQEQGTGDLYVQTNGTNMFLRDSASGNTFVAMNTGTADVSLKQGGNTKLTTTSTGVTVTGNLVMGSGQVKFADNGKLMLGDSNDLQIYHDGSHSYIQDTGTGDLKLQASNDIFLLDGSGNVMIEASEGGSVDLFHNGSKKFETTSTGATITGDLLINTTGGYFEVDVSDNSIKHADNTKAKFGTANDLEIFHDGSHSRIKDVGTGHLILNATDFVVNNSGDSANMIIATDGGSVDLYHSGNKKFETTSTGVTISNNLTLGSTSATGLLSLPNNGEINLFNANDDNKFTIRNTGSALNTLSIELNDGTDALTIAGDGDATFAGSLKSNTDFVVQVDADNNTSGSVFKILGGGGSELFRVNEAGEVLTGNTSVSSAGEKFNVTGNGIVTEQSDGGVATMLGGFGGSDGIIGTFTNSHLKIRTNNNDRIVVLNTGSVGIGTTSPSRKIECDFTGSVFGARFTRSDASGSSLIEFANSAGVKSVIGYDAGEDAFKIGTDSANNVIVKQGGDATFAGNVSLADSKELIFGNGSDLKITHNGTNTEFNNYNGGVNFVQHQADGHIIFYADNGSGTATEYFRLDGGEAINVFSRKARFLDNVQATFGTADDFKISHDGSATYVQNVTSHLIIENQADDSDIIFKSDDGSGGVTPYITLDGLNGRTNFDVDAQFTDNKKVRLGSSADLQLYHTGSESNILNLTGNLNISNDATDKDIVFKSDDGSGGTAEYMRIDGSQESIRMKRITKWDDNIKATFGDSTDLQIYHDGTNSYVEQTGTGDLIIRNSTDDKDILLQTDNGSGNVTSYIQLDGSDLSTKILTQKVILSNLPTSDPNNAGQLYNESGFLRVSAG